MSDTKDRVFICSPFRGRIEANTRYAKAAVLDSFARGESPIALHLLYPQVMDDSDIVQRERALSAGFDWVKASSKVVVYSDRGVSEGMRLEMDVAQLFDIPVEYRTLPDYEV